MAKKIIVIVSIVAWFTQLPYSQNLQTVLGQNIEDQDQVVELEVARSVLGKSFMIAPVVNNRAYPQACIGKEGKQYYKINLIPGWKGKIEFVMTDLEQGAIVSANIVDPSLKSHWNIFMHSNALDLRKVNFLPKRELFNLSFTLILLGCFSLISILSFFLFKKSMWGSFFLGALLCTMLFDGREMVERWEILNKAKATFPYVEPQTRITQFTKQIKPIMEGADWTFRGTFDDPYYKQCIKYELIDQYFYPEVLLREGPPPPSGTFIISKKPLAKEKVLLEANGFYLTQLP